MPWLVYLKFNNNKVSHINASHKNDVLRIVETAKVNGLSEYIAFYSGRSITSKMGENYFPETSITSQDNQDSEHIKNLVFEKTRRLRLLEIQQAKHGIKVDPVVVIEINDLKEEIKDLLDLYN